MHDPLQKQYYSESLQLTVELFSEINEQDDVDHVMVMMLLNEKV